MYVKQVVLFGLLFLSSCCCDRVWLNESSCDRRGTGFLCLPKIGEKRTIIFECPVKNRHYQIYINEFNGPKSLEKLIIKNCKSLTVLFQCTKTPLESKNLTYLEISNIEKLKIEKEESYQSLLPPTVVLENIKSIKKIPSHTFTQTNKTANRKRCVLPDYNFSAIYFRNVSINKVQEKAFYMPNDFGNVTFTNVKIKMLDRSSLIINQRSGGVFIVEYSTLGQVKKSAVQVVAGKTVFSNNKFTEISSTGIKVETDVFNFVNNSIEGKLHSQGLAVASRHTIVSYNRFRHLKTGAFSGIGSSEKIGYYEFVGNVMDCLEHDSLLPKSYSQVTVQRNTFSCECDKSGWLLSKNGSKDSGTTADTFYRRIFDEQSENVCSSTCNLPINAAQAKIVHGKCINSKTVTDLCAAKKTQAQRVTVTPESNTNSMFPKLFTPHMSTVRQSNGTAVLSKIDKGKLGSNATTLLTTNKVETFDATNKSINKKELMGKTTLALSTTKITTSTITLTKTLPSVTTLPTTKRESGVVNETVQLFTAEYNVTTQRQQHITATTTSKHFLTPFHEANANSKQVEKNCSNIYSLSSFIWFFIFNVVFNVL